MQNISRKTVEINRKSTTQTVVTDVIFLLFLYNVVDKKILIINSCSCQIILVTLERFSSMDVEMVSMTIKCL